MNPLPKKITKRPTARVRPASRSRIRERARELAMNHGKQPVEADAAEIRRAERELLEMELTSPGSPLGDQ